jgi:predicted methyltransferase
MNELFIVEDFMFRTLSLCMLLTLVSCGHMGKHHKGHHCHQSSEKIVQGDHRSQENRDRNVYRNPVETLRFFEVEPHMSVVEVSPGRGWYTEILGPYLKNKGQLYLATFREDNSNNYRRDMALAIRSLVSDNPQLFGRVEVTTFDLPDHVGPIAPEASVDRVLTFRNIHGFMRANKEKEVFSEFFRVLKPGGILGVVQHRESATKRQDPKTESGYVREDYVIELALAAGFEFVAKSEVNANYLDTRNHPNGVWSLPPTLREGDKDRSRFLAIGESDRMTIKFRKPQE